MAITESYQKAASTSNAKLFKNVSLRIGSMLLREQADGFIEGFSTETKGATGLKARHVVFEIRAAQFSARKVRDPKLKDCDFSIYLSADKTGPVTVSFYPVGHKARDLLGRIVGKDRLDEVKGPHIVSDVTSKKFKTVVEILAGVLSRSGQNFHKTSGGPGFQR